MGLFSKETKVMLTYEDGLQGVKQGVIVTLSLHDDELNIKENFSKKEPTKLKLNQIVNAGKVFEKDIIEKDKSVLGRAALGGLILGPIGAVVGGISGTGKKEKKTYKTYYIVNYRSSHDDETKVLSFSAMENGNSIGLSKFDKELRDKANIREVEEQREYL